jgi:predicted SnoaL-like aldol condensation-catalyzing enzyme
MANSNADNKSRIRALLEGIETGDPASVEVVNAAKYIQHNPQTHEGSEGLAALFARLAKTNPRVNIVRAFEDGDFVFAHTEYEFSTSRVGFEVFRFEDGQAVEHWDNIQPRRGPNASGRSMVDGPTEADDLSQTEQNRSLVRAFVADVLIAGRLDQLARYVADDLVQHDPTTADGAAALRAALEATSDQQPAGPALSYQRLHRVLAEGSFVLAVSEGTLAGVHSALYDLYRVADGQLVEHWNTVESIAPRSEWRNDNGKF